MAARLPAIADLVVTWLNDPSRSWPAVYTGVTAVRTYQPIVEFEDLAALQPRVEVVPPEFGQEEPLTRGLEQLDYTLYIGVRQRYTQGGTVPNAWVDDRIELVELIADALKDTELAASPQLRVQSAAPNPTWDPESLQRRQTFVGVIEVIVREYRER